MTISQADREWRQELRARRKDQSHKTARNCLKCGELFDSTGPGNRLCGRCNTENAQMRDMLPPSSVGFHKHTGKLAE